METAALTLLGVDMVMAHVHPDWSSDPLVMGLERAACLMVHEAATSAARASACLDVSAGLRASDLARCSGNSRQLFGDCGTARNVRARL